MNVAKKTQLGKTKKNKRNIRAEPVSELYNRLHEIQTSTSSQFMTPGKKPLLFHVVTSNTQLPLFLVLNQIRI